MRHVNHIQVYGLPRSGTNFIEWTLRYNFVGLNYDRTDDFVNDVPGSKPYYTMLKHCYPNLNNSEYAIIIFKEWEDWLESIQRIGWKLDIDKKGYYKYIDTALKLDENRTYVVGHKWAVANYFTMLNEISSKFCVKLVDNPTYPTQRVSMDYGKTLTDKIYVQ